MQGRQDIADESVITLLNLHGSFLKKKLPSFLNSFVFWYGFLGM